MVSEAKKLAKKQHQVDHLNQSVDYSSINMRSALSNPLRASSLLPDVHASRNINTDNDPHRSNGAPGNA